jgi:hypothetical protein
MSALLDKENLFRLLRIKPKMQIVSIPIKTRIMLRTMIGENSRQLHAQSLGDPPVDMQVVYSSWIRSFDIIIFPTVKIPKMATTIIKTIIKYVVLLNKSY